MTYVILTNDHIMMMIILGLITGWKNHMCNNGKKGVGSKKKMIGKFKSQQLFVDSQK